MKSQNFILMIAIFLSCLTQATALVFERRSRPNPELSNFLYPVAGSIPGVQDFYGLGATVSGIGGSEVDITAVSLRGEAKHFQDGDFGIEILTVLDIPVFTPHLTFSLFYTDIRNGTWPEGERGIDSEREKTYYLLGSKIYGHGGEMSLNFSDYQLEFYYGFVNSGVTPYGLVDPNGTFYSAQRADLNENPMGYRYGIYLDDTDHRRDPRIGYRFQWDRWDMPASRGENSSFYQDDFNLTGYIPLLENNQGVLVLNQFVGTSHVRKAGTVNRDNYLCNESLSPGCQSILDVLYKRQVAEAERGRATTLGGTQRLRGYRTNRFYDSYTHFRGIEYRWYLIETQDAFNYFIERGTFAGFQAAVFYEEGTVSPDMGSSFWKNFRNSYGLGGRFLFNSVIFRIDHGFSQEDSETTVYIGYGF